MGIIIELLCSYSQHVLCCIILFQVRNLWWHQSSQMEVFHTTSLHSQLINPNEQTIISIIHIWWSD